MKRPIRSVPAGARRDPSRELLLAASAAAATCLLAWALGDGRPTYVDRQTQRLARSRAMRGVDRALLPLFPLGLPGGYITIGHLVARWLARRQRAGGRAIVTSAWLGWTVHRAFKFVYERERPRRPGVRRRRDSYPSGHTTGTTALAVCAARVLEREGLITKRQALAIGVGAPVVMGAYRVIDDEHWLTDVAGGLLLGGAIALACDATLSGARGARSSKVRELAPNTSASRRRGRRGPATSAG